MQSSSKQNFVPSLLHYVVHGECDVYRHPTNKRATQVILTCLKSTTTVEKVES